MEPAFPRFMSQAVGPRYDFKDQDVEHIGMPLVEIARKFNQPSRPSGNQD